MLLCFGEGEEQDTHGLAVLRFEARWLKESGFSAIVEEVWALSGPQAQNLNLDDCLAPVHSHLHRWDRTTLKRTKLKLRKAQKDLEEVTRGELTPENIRRHKELADEIEKLLEFKEIECTKKHN